MAKVLGLLGAALGSIAGLTILNLFIYGLGVNFLGLILAGGICGVLGGLAALGVRHCCKLNSPIAGGAIGMTVVWFGWLALVVVLDWGVPSIGQFLLGAIAMAGVGAVSGMFQGGVESIYNSSSSH